MVYSISVQTLRTISLLLTGTIKPNMQHLVDLNARETIAAGLLVSGIIGLGFMPSPLIELSAATITQMINQISQRLL